jgi:hypothetical protein
MQRAFVAAVIGLTLGGLVGPAAAARKPKLGVFGKINGQAFKASNTKRLTELVGASYLVDQETGFSILTFSGTEKPRPRGKSQLLIVSCLVPTTVAPWSSACIASYSEVQIKRRSILQRIWLAEVTVDGNGVATGPFSVTLESFDGSTMRGRFSGSFASEQTCTTGACVEDPSLGTVSGEGTFTITGF